MEDMMRLLTIATLFAAACAGSSTFAQDNRVHHAWCLVSETGHNCGYQTLAQCKASKTGNTDRCVRNGRTRGTHPGKLSPGQQQQIKQGDYYKPGGK